EQRLLTLKGEAEYGWLVNAQGTYATMGSPSFSHYHAESRSIVQRRVLPGCQAYFSGDGVWGFWNGGQGGPIQRFHLATGQTRTIVAKDDPRLPANRNYVYFPMLSRCQRLLALAASP